MTSSDDKKTAVALLSGGKDSTYAMYRASQQGYDIERLVSVHPTEGSYMYHVPAIELTSLIAESVGTELVTLESSDIDDEIEPLRRVLSELDDEIGVDAVVTGAVESDYQKSRIDALCDELGFESVAPLWHSDPSEKIREIVEEFEVIIIGVAADGLDESWLGRKIDEDAIRELEELNDEKGVHVMGEGGEFETLVLNGPHMDSRLEVEYEKEWDGMRGKLRITDAYLEE